MVMAYSKVFITKEQTNNKRVKVVVVDPLSPFGHKDINKVFLCNLSDEYEVTYIASSSFSDIVPNHIKFIPIESSLFTIGPNSLDNRKRLFRALRIILDKVRGIEPEVLFFMSYETLTFALLSHAFFIKGCKVFLMNHLNVDELETSSIKRLAFKSLPKNFTHIVYEDFIRDYVINKYNRKCLTLQHNLNTYKINALCPNSKLKKFFESDKDSILFVAPSGNFLGNITLDEIIKLDKNGYFKEKKFRVFIKNKGIQYESDNLLITNEYLSDGEYTNAFIMADYIFLPYNLSYKYRASGVYFDALTFCKPIIYSNTLFFMNQIERFGELGISLKETVKETFDGYSLENFEIHKSNINKARLYYSDDNYRNRIKSIIEL